MGNSECEPLSDAGRHRRTEEWLQDRIACLSQFSPDEVAELVHELDAQRAELQRHNEELRADENRYRRVIEDVDGGIWEIDADGATTFVNRPMAAMLGYRVEEMLGKHLFSFMDESKVELCQQYLQRRQAGLSEQHDFEFRHKEGRSVYTRVGATAYRDEGGNYRGSIALVLDMTQRRRAEEAMLRGEAELKESQRLARIGNWEWFVDTDTVVWSDELYRIAKRDPSLPAPTFREHSQLYTQDSWARLERAVQCALQTGTAYELDLEMVLPDDSRRGVVGRGEALRDSNGRVVRLRGTVQDISDRKRAEEMLQESELLFRQAMLVGKCFPFGWNPITDEVIRSPEFADILGLAAEDAVRDTGQRYFQRIVPEDRDQFVNAIRQLTPANDSYVASYRLIRGDGSTAHLEETAKGFFNGDGKLIRLLGIVADVTERKQSEEALHREQSLLGSVMQATDVMLVLLDAQFNFLWVNPAYAQTCNMQPEEMVGKNHFALYPNADNEVIFRQVRDTGEGVFYKDKPFVFPDQPERGVTYWDWSLEPLKDGSGSVNGLVFSLRETTRFKQTKEALRESEERFRLFMDNSPTIAWVKDEQGRHVYLSKTYENRFGVRRDDWLGKTDTELWPREVAEQFHKNDLLVLATGRPLEIMEETIDPDGGRTCWLNTKFLFCDADGNRYVGGIGLDITARKQAEEALKTANGEIANEKNRLEAVLEALPIGVAITDVQGGNIRSNRMFNEIWGGSHPTTRSVSDYPAYRAWWVETGKAVQPEEWASAQAVRERIPVVGQMMEIQGFDGTRKFVINSGAPIFDSEGEITGCAVAIQDVSALKRAEEQLKAINETLEQRVAERTAESQWRANQLQQLAAQMTQAEERERRRLAQVLHDGLQQVLVAAKLRLISAAQKAQDPLVTTIIKEAANLVDESITESRSLTKELSPPVLYDGGLAAGLEWLGRDTEKKYQLPTTVMVAPEMEPDDLTTKILVFQAARELVLNAVKHAHASCLKICLARMDENRLQVTVQDDGTGFASDITSRKEARGGFGLFSIRERLDVIGGELMIASTPLEGTKATIIAPCRRLRLPRVSVESVSEGFAPTKAASARTNRVRVLLADDHPMLRKGIGDMLMEHPDVNLLGEAANGQEALEKAVALQPDVVLMDVTMPVMDGIEATRRIKEAAPDIRIIGLSMHESDDLAAKMKEAGASEYLVKTVAAEELIGTILGQGVRE